MTERSFNEDPQPQAPRGSGTPFERILQRRLSRRRVLRGAVVGAPLLVLGASPAGSRLLGGAFAPPAQAAIGAPGLTFAPVAAASDDTVQVPDGYELDVLLRWGDPIVAGAPAFDLGNQSGIRQSLQFGYNCDFSAFMPLMPGSSTSGLICVNHEYTTGIDMFPGYDAAAPTRGQVDTELAAHGMSIVAIRRSEGGPWEVDLASPSNRRITATTVMQLTGPAAGHALLRTPEDPSGTLVLGMLNNCAGGKTPWGTVLTCEENFNQYFGYADEVTSPEQQEINARYGLPGAESERHWEDFYERFDLRRSPREPNRFGWVVEIDPYDAGFTPRKRTALGRLKHEGATTGLADDLRVVVYSGDDERFDYLYKFVSHGRFNPTDRPANRGLLDSGALYAARFHDDGTGEWLPLTPQGPLASWSQAEILIKTRLAADALEATPMDRPEDVEVNPRTRKVYLALTNNTRREAGDENGPNPRAENAHGHIIEITEDDGDLGATTFTWDIFLLCGDPTTDPTAFYQGADPSQVSPVSAPDNVTFDNLGNLWIATDGQPRTLETNDAIHAVATAGPERGLTKRFLTGPLGSEVCGPEFTPDYTSLFANIQHPGEGSGLESPDSLWPDGAVAARPSLIAVRKADGGRIGV